MLCSLLTFLIIETHKDEMQDRSNKTKMYVRECNFHITCLPFLASGVTVHAPLPLAVVAAP
jgi:hypothetical protein